MAMEDIEWTADGLETIEIINRSTKIEKFTKKLNPTELLELSTLDELDIFHEDSCEVLEGICQDALYLFICLSQRNMSNHQGKND